MGSTFNQPHNAMAKSKAKSRTKKQSAKSDPLVQGNGHAKVEAPAFLHMLPPEGYEYEGDLEITPVRPSDFDRETLLQVYRTMLTSRRLDEKMLTLLRQGKGFFHIGCAGHEAAQAAAYMNTRPGYDWASVYYRDLAFVLGLGARPEDVLLHHLAKRDDPFSGGRQMAEHFSIPELNVLPLCSSVGSQLLPAVGVALAIQRRKQDAYVYASIGEGGTSQGAWHEALNWAARAKAPVLFFVQDNRYAISVPRTEQTAGGSVYKIVQGYENLARAHVDGTDFFKAYAVLKAAIERIRQGRGPVCVVAEVVRLLPHSSSDNHLKYRAPEELEEDRRADPIMRFELRLIEEGLLTEREAEEIRREVARQIDEAAAWAEKQPDPEPESAVRHVYFEGDLGLEFEKSTPSGEPVVMVDAINHALHEEMERDERVIVYGEDVEGPKGGVFTVTRGLTERFGVERCFNSPLAENAIIGTAVGLAEAGFKPVVEIQFGDYIWPAMDALKNQLATVRYRSNGKWEAPVVVRVPVGGYIHGGLCHSQNIEAFFAHVPGLWVVMPSNAADAKGLLKTAIRGRDPVLFLEHKYLYRQPVAKSPEPDADYLIPFGKARIVQEGSDLTIVTYGALVYKSLNVARMMEKHGVSLEIIDLRTINPLDTETILESVKKTNRLLVVYEDQEFGGFGGEIVSQVADKAFTFLDAPIKRVAGKFTPIPFAEPLENYVLPQDDDILQAVEWLLEF